jgi:phage terminase large subunit GpA-like protein
VKGRGQEAAIHAGLEALTNDLLARRWTRDDGAEMSIERCLIDANWGESTDTVYQFCRATAHAAQVMPAHGKYVGASSRPWEQYTKKDGERLGHHWMLPSVKGKRAVRHVLTDVNYWKTFVHQRLAAPAGGDACLSLFGRKGERGPRSDDHRMFAEHLTAEYRVKTQGQGRTVDEWKPKPGKPDNHWFDCLVGCCVAASMLGCNLVTAAPPPAKKSRRFKRVSYL